jgi:uncharacterized membrane-anchored protein
MFELPPTFTQFLAFIGAPAFAAFVVSELLETNAWFQGLENKFKGLFVLLLSLVLALVSYFLTKWVPEAVQVDLQPIYAVIVGTVAAFIAGQIWHNTAHKDSTSVG